MTHPRATADDTIGRRLDELAGDHSEPERDLVRRLVESFLRRAPRHLAALRDAFDRGDVAAFEDEAHSLKGAAGTLGAAAVAAICDRLEDRARTGTLPPGTPHELDLLRAELRRAEDRLRQELPPLRG